MIPNGRQLRVTPPDLPFTPRERRLIASLRTPRAVQRWLNRLTYNTEHDGETQQSFRSVVSSGRAHCMEAALSAAVILEQYGYPPLVMSLESVDMLDHVLFVYRTPRGWGSVARSRDPGLHGRRPVFATARALATSYIEPYVDRTGRLRGYAIVDMAAALPRYDWRLSTRNLWKAEQLLIDTVHRPLRMSDGRYRTLRAQYIAHIEATGLKPVDYRNRDTWEPLGGIQKSEFRIQKHGK